MSYMLLVLQPADRTGPSAEVGRDRYERMMRFASDLTERGLLVAGESLGSGAAGVRISKRGGRATILDGPFVEAKEMVGGFFLVNCRTKEEAVAIAQECPAIEWSTVEVREVGPCWEDAGIPGLLNP